MFIHTFHFIYPVLFLLYSSGFVLFCFVDHTSWYVGMWVWSGMVWVCGYGWGLPNQGLNSCPLPWKHRVLTTRLPGKSPHSSNSQWKQVHFLCDFFLFSLIFWSCLKACRVLVSQLEIELAFPSLEV